ncbi:MAG: hypothetical protein Q3997_09405, partial [Propionibacteriaceae bacterium]|nr:hypothetical protein [Propionibacteriaceae bacterium]
MSDTPAPDTPAQLSPLLPSDPAKVGDFWLDARLTATPAGVAFAAHEDGSDETVMLIMTSQGAASDAAARARFSGEINKLHIDTVIARGGEGQDEGRLGHRFRGEEDDPTAAVPVPLAPWAALAYDGTVAAVTEAQRILTSIDLTTAPPLSQPSGPGFQLHWIDETAPGAHRLWPLPWPGRADRAGWVTMFTSWLLMILLAALAILLALLLFQNAPPQSPPPPLPTQGEGSGDPSQDSQSSPPPSQNPSSAPPSSQNPASSSPSPESAS